MEYKALDEDIWEKFSYPDFYSLKQRNIPREWNKAVKNQQNFDLMHKVGRFTIRSFDKSAKSTTKAWIQKLDTYLQLNSMTEA
jgi:hypothetical protein